MTKLERFAFPLNRLDRMFDNLFQELPALTPFGVDGGGVPALNAWAEDETYVIEAELPGLNIEDLDIQVKGEEVTIQGERKFVELEGATYHRRERGVGRFRRSLRFPEIIDAEKVEATLKNGVLTIRLPKSEESKPRKITVQTA